MIARPETTSPVRSTRILSIKHLLMLSMLLCSLALTGCLQLNLPIAQAVVKDDFAITLDNNGTSVKLRPGRFFSIDSLRLKENTAPLSINNPNILTCYRNGSLGNGKYIDALYPVTIMRGGHTFYGRMAFFQAARSARMQGVTNYYQVSVPDQYFADALAGRTTCAYEYWKSGGGGYVTWIIWLSDVPLKTEARPVGH